MAKSRSQKTSFTGAPPTTAGAKQANPLQATGQPASPYDPPTAPNVVRGTIGLKTLGRKPTGGTH